MHSLAYQIMLAHMSWTLFLAVVAFLLPASAEAIPRELKWTDDTFGPDGPWRAIQVQMGYEETPIGLFPGSAWETWLIDDNYCQTGTCYASKAGTYDKSSGDDGGIRLDGGLNSFMLGLNLEGEPGTRYLDDMSLNGISVVNVSLVLLESQMIRYPGGQTSPFFAGCLSLGGTGATNQTFTLNDAPAINASLPPGWMWETEWTPSNSFGMHIGSVQPAMSGSLWFGGYDQNRIVGDILSMKGYPRNGITLWDIGIEDIGNNSLFEPSTADSLLAKGNSSIVSGLKVSIDGCSPYLTLPKSTCDNIATHLPVSFNEDLGLYLWDTKSDKYHDIISSATALSLSFISGSNTKLLKIRVPFVHLNLTLSAPLVNEPVPYFPCHVNDKGVYVLGRAFLQDAFIGANWDPSAETWWLAQAPGRNIQATTNVVSIGKEDKTIVKGGNDWKVSWDGVWNDDSDEQAPSSTPTSDANDQENNKDVRGGMSTGAKAGIGIGGAAVFLALGLGAVFFWRRRRSQAAQAQPAQTPSATSQKTASSEPLPNEMPNHEMQQESSSPYQRHELPS